MHLVKYVLTYLGHPGHGFLKNVLSKAAGLVWFLSLPEDFPRSVLKWHRVEPSGNYNTGDAASSLTTKQLLYVAEHSSTVLGI